MPEKRLVRGCCSTGNTSQNLGVGWCLTLRNELSRATHILTKEETSWKVALRWREARYRNPGELLFLLADSLRFYGNGVSFWVVSGQSPSWWHKHLRWIPEKRTMGSWSCPPSFFPPPDFSQCQHHVPYLDLLLWDNLSKWLSSCLAKVGDLSQWFPRKPI